VKFDGKFDMCRCRVLLFVKIFACLKVFHFLIYFYVSKRDAWIYQKYPARVNRTADNQKSRETPQLFFQKQTNGPIEWCSELNFSAPGNINQTVALASFPGSGNTWLRYLLEQATGIYTGSVYADDVLVEHNFTDRIVNSSVLVVKTHLTNYGTFGKAVLLIRDPMKAILADFNRINAGHVGLARQFRFTSVNGTKS
jgi:hypothetical protein